MRLIPWLGLLVALLPSAVVSGDPLTPTRTWEDRPIPPESAVGRLGPGERHLVLSAMERGSPVRPGGWNLRDVAVRPAEAAVAPRLGFEALQLKGVAQGSAKGDFAVAGEVPGRLLALGAWFYLPPGANVKSVGFQIYDAEGEALLHLAPADWSGWRWVETPVSADAFEQAYPQADKDRAPGSPIRGVNVIWWSKDSGRTALVCDALMARTTGVGASEGALRVELASGTDIARGEPFRGLLLIANPGDRPADAEVVASLQEDGQLRTPRQPDPDLGADHALDGHSRTVADGKAVAEDTLTDGLDYTAAETAWTGRWTSADEFVTLDRVREVTALGWRAGDANWIWKVDVLSSEDGEKFTPVPELQGVVLREKWGVQRFPAFRPFRAKGIQLRYHRDGQAMDVVKMPAALMVWDGPTDDRFDLPRAGREVGRLQIRREMPAGSFAAIRAEFPARLSTGQYLFATRATARGKVSTEANPVFVGPASLERVGEDSPFGLNGAVAALAAEHRTLGIGWVRFENLKWPFVSPAPHRYAFDGSTLPWAVDMDQIARDYRAAGLNVLPMMFQTPTWASGAGDDIAEGVRLSQPPREPADFGEFAFQTAARYGSRPVDPARLLTTDRVSGLGLIGHFELGNEPNLNPLRDPEHPPTWGSWTGTMSQWWPMWRLGAEGVKAADPQARVLSPGFAGATVETVDELRTFRYADGKTPLDFVDVLSVHYYSGRIAPEVATGDGNTGRESDRRFVEHLRELVAWRDQHRPRLPIWMTETGYDSAGPIGTDERTQAARLPRVVALCLANGVDKVFVYRESGSSPSQHAAAGVFRDDLSRKPSWYTYATLIRQLDGATPGPRLRHEDNRVSLLAWRRGGRTLVMANTATGTAPLGMELGPSTLTDAFGHSRPVESTRDLTLGEFPIYIELPDDAALRRWLAPPPDDAIRR